MPKSGPAPNSPTFAGSWDLKTRSLPNSNMAKTALLFAGQGAQVVGMGKDLAERFPSARSWFDRANAVLGYDLAAICFQGPEGELGKTETALRGIFLASWICF